MADVIPIRSNAAETIELHGALVDAISGSGEAFSHSVDVIRRNDNQATEELLNAMEAAHLRLVAVALRLAQNL